MMLMVGEATAIELENRELRAKNDVLERQLRVALRDLSLVRARLEAELRRRLGSKAARIDPNQLEIAFEELVDAVLADSEPEPPAGIEEAPDAEEAPAAPKKKGAHGRTPLPKNLTRVRVEYRPQDTHCGQCRREMTPMGEEVTEELDWQPACFFVTEHVRVKYACKHCQEGVAIAPLPPRPIEKGRPGPGLLAHVLVSKYADHRVPRRHAQQPQGRRSKPCCMEDEGRPLGIGVQAQVPNHLKLLGSRVRVVSVEGTARQDRVR